MCHMGRSHYLSHSVHLLRNQIENCQIEIDTDIDKDPPILKNNDNPTHGGNPHSNWKGIYNTSMIAQAKKDRQLLNTIGNDLLPGLNIHV